MNLINIARDQLHGSTPPVLSRCYPIVHRARKAVSDWVAAEVRAAIDRGLAAAHVGEYWEYGNAKPLLALALACAVLPTLSIAGAEAPVQRIFRAGAHAIDVTPTNFPVIINGGFFAMHADRAVDRLHARCLVLDDGTVRVGLCVLDSCLIPREFADEAKREIQKATGLAPERVMISATHTHYAPSLMSAHGVDADARYSKYLLPRLAEGFRLAVSNLAPARVGWAVVPAPEHTHTRVWIRRPDRVESDPFGERTVRANMHPGHENPAAIAPSGPSDPDLSLLAVETPDGRPIAVLANYAMHYHGGTKPVSADYFGRFADQLGGLLGAGATQPAFVAMMSQGASGDQQWMDYSKPARNVSIDAYAAALAQLAQAAYRKIQWHDWVPLAMRDQDLPLRTRQPSAQRLAWAREVVAAFQGRQPKTLPEVYAREQIWLHDNPVRPVKLQALRVGELGMVTASAEVFAISSLKVKAQSPLRPTFFIELANGEDGYIPPPEHHALGSYNTWACRTACLEVDAENKIVDRLLALLEEVSGLPRLGLVETDGTYAKAVRASNPITYWRLNELDGRNLPIAAGRDRAATAESGVVFFLDGPMSPAFSGSNTVNRAYHFAGGRLKSSASELGPAYSVEFWFWNGLPHAARAVTGHLFSRGAHGVYGAPGEHLSIGGTRAASGRLIFANGGSDTSAALTGRTELAVKTWHHVALVRDGAQVAVYLNGDSVPEIQGQIEPGHRSDADQLFFGGRSDNASNFEGKLDEIAVYPRALDPGEIVAHFRSAGLQPPTRLPTSLGTGIPAAALASLKPVAQWLNSLTDGRTVANLAGLALATAEEGVTLPSVEATAAQFSGGRLRAAVPSLGTNYTVAFWFLNDTPNTSRSVTAYLFSRGEDGAENAPGDHLGIGGTHSHTGRLILFNGNERNELVAGRTELTPGRWHHIVLVREGRQVRVYLNLQREPDLSGELDPGSTSRVEQLFFGGRSDRFAPLQGRMSEIAVFTRALRAEEILATGRPMDAVASPPANTHQQRER